MSFVFIICVSYLLGSIPSAVWVSKWFYKQDVRLAGSKNAGLTNVYRVFGWKASLPVAFADLGKGTISTWLGYTSSQDIFISRNFALIAGLVCILGHSYTCFAGFSGGKGVLTALGVYLYLVPASALGAFGVWLLVLVPTGLVSLASISAAIAIVIFVFLQFMFGSATLLMVILTGILSSFVIFKHRTNISRLISGTENRFGKKSAV